MIWIFLAIAIIIIFFLGFIVGLFYLACSIHKMFRPF